MVKTLNSVLSVRQLSYRQRGKSLLRGYYPFHHAHEVRPSDFKHIPVGIERGTGKFARHAFGFCQYELPVKKVEYPQCLPVLGQEQVDIAIEKVPVKFPVDKAAQPVVTVS